MAEIVVIGNVSGFSVTIELPEIPPGSLRYRRDYQVMLSPERAREIGANLIEAAAVVRFAASICAVLVASGKILDQAEAVLEQAAVDAALVD